MKSKAIFLFYNLVIVLVVASLIESLLGYWLNNPTKIPSYLKDIYITYYQFQDRQIIQVTECGIYDEGLFYTLKPGECVFENREFKVKNKVNSLGLRDDENDLDYPSIIVMGDSFTMGWGVEQDKTFPEILEHQLKTKVLNAGISSYGTVREMELLKRIKKDSLKYLLIQYHPTDYEENLKYFENGNELIISPKKEYTDLKAYIDQRQKYFPGKHIAYVAKFFLVKIAGKLHDGSVRYEDAEEAKMFLNSLENAGIDLNSTKLIVFELESFVKNDDLFTKQLYYQIQNGHYPAYIENIQTIEFSHKLDDSDYFILDDHLNENGHAKVAEEIMKKLKNTNHSI